MFPYCFFWKSCELENAADLLKTLGLQRAKTYAIDEKKNKHEFEFVRSWWLNEQIRFEVKRHGTSRFEGDLPILKTIVYRCSQSQVDRQILNWNVPICRVSEVSLYHLHANPLIVVQSEETHGLWVVNSLILRKLRVGGQLTLLRIE